MRPTLRKIADITGYSTATVSRALSGSSLITAGTRRAVLNCAREIGYKFDTCREVALIVPGYSFEWYYGALVNRLCTELEHIEYVPVIISLGHLELLERLPFCGAISLLGNDGFEVYWGERHIMPLVCINTSARHLDGIFMVGSNDAQGMRLALEHLIGLGHRKIGRVGSIISFDYPHSWNSHNRDISFCKIMRANNLSADYKAIVTGNNQIEVIKKLLDQGVTALISLHEGMEAQVVQAVSLLGWKIPEQVSIISWSDGTTTPYLQPSVTTLEQDYGRLVRESCRIFRDLLAGEIVSGDILVDYRFNIRASTGPVN